LAICRNPNSMPSICQDGSLIPKRFKNKIWIKKPGSGIDIYRALKKSYKWVWTTGVISRILF